MRVISGCARGTVLFAPSGAHTRPTANRIKEDMFNIIAPQLTGARFLDLFSGTGQIGIEALSRGALSAVFVESDKKAADIIRKNIIKCRLDKPKSAILICADVTNTLQKLATSGQTFDIVFIDPPYDSDELSKTAAALTTLHLLSDTATIITEQPASIPQKDLPGLHTYRLKKYTTTRLTFMRLETTCTTE